MKKNFTLLLGILCLVFNTTIVNAQVSGDYRSAVVTGNWSDITSWQTYDGTTWLSASVYPQYNTAGSNDVTILNGHNITVDAAAGSANQLYIKQTIVSNGGTITIGSGQTLWVFDGTAITDLTVNGSIINNGNFKLNSGSPAISFGATGYYQHNINGTQIPNSSWTAGSVCEITGVTSTVPSGITTQVTPFSNFIWNNTQTVNLSLITTVGNYTITNGNFTVAKCGSGFKVRLFGTAATTTSSVSIGGNLIVNNSIAQVILYSNAANATSFNVNVTGNVQLSAGILGLSDGVGTGSILNVSGNFLYSGGALSANSTGKGTINVTNAFNVSTLGTVAVTSANNINLNATTGSANFAPGTFLSISSSASTFNFNGRPVVFQSDATGTAGLSTVSGVISNATNVTVQRYIPSSSRKKYTLVSSPVSGTTINAAWQEGTGTGNTFVTAAGFGTPITGAVSQGTNGFDGPSTSTASIFTYNDANISGTKWTALSGTTTASSIASGKGYLLFVRGDRSENRATTGNSSNTVLRATGTLTTGSVNFAISGGTAGTPALLATSGSYNLIANPYACAIDWLAAGTAKSNVGGSFYVYDPNTGTFITCDGSTVSPVTTPVTQQSPRYIQSGQAFFILSTSVAPALTIAESSKVTSISGASNTTVFGGDSSAKPQLNLNIYRTVGNVFADGVVALFGNGYSRNVNMDEDAAKFANFNESFSLRSSGQNLSIEKRPLFLGNDTLYFNLGNFSKRDYSFVIDGSNFSNTNATLEDKYTATKTLIDLTGNTTYNFTINDDTASSSNDRFIITLGSTATIAANDIINNNLFVKMSPNPVSNQLQVSFKTEKAEQTTINIVNSLGQVVKNVNAGKTDNGNINISVTSLSAGIYTVQLLSGDKQIAIQKLVKE